MSGPVPVAGAGRLRCRRGGFLTGICARCDVPLQLIGQLDEGVGAVTQGGRSVKHAENRLAIPSLAEANGDSPLEHASLVNTCALETSRKMALVRLILCTDRGRFGGSFFY